MSSLPTLLRKGYIIPPNNLSDKDTDKILNTISIEYVLQILSNKIQNPETGRIKDTITKAGDKVIILKSDTGSGKSTILPPKLYEKFKNKLNRSIIVTQPRILTAVDIPNDIVKYNSFLKLGENIGYNTGKFKNIPKSSGIVFATVGILLQDLLMNDDEAFISKYQFIIIDEVHERNVETDQCLFMLKKFLKGNYEDPRCPIVILMSATFDEKIFINYFNVPQKNYIQVKGSTFPIETTFTKYTVTNYVEYASLQAQKLHMENLADLDETEEYRDIIIFVKDSGIGKQLYKELHKFNTDICNDSKKFEKYTKEIETKMDNLLSKVGGSGTIKQSFYILPILLDSKNFNKGNIDYQNLFSSIDLVTVPLWKTNVVLEGDPTSYAKPSRRIIISTNIAETGVTIPTLKYCIDTGYELKSEFYPEFGCSALIAKNIFQGAAIQRRGRVGRKAPGFFFPVYTNSTFDLLPKDKIFDIINSDSTDALLNTLIKEKNVEIVQESKVSIIKNNKNEDIFQMFKNVTGNWYRINNDFSTNIASLDFLEMPSIQSLSYSMERLYNLGFIDKNYDITGTGYIANKFQWISLECRKMILASYFFNVSTLDIITIVAFIYISKRNIFEKTFDISQWITDDHTIMGIDDFISCIIVWDKFQSYLTNSEKSAEKSLNQIEKWCVKSGLKFDGLMEVIYMRDKIIDDMVKIGLNPFYNRVKENSYNSPEDVKDIKMCVYEGYKCNMFKHNSGNLYNSCFNDILIKVKSNILKKMEIKPSYIIVDNYTLAQKFDDAQYEFLSDGMLLLI
jgi:HrpA-like RNA helicase